MEHFLTLLHCWVRQVQHFLTEVLTFSNTFRWKVQLVSPGIEDEFDFRRSVVSINQLSLRKDWIEFHGMKTASSERRYMRSWAAKTDGKKRHLPFKTFVQTFEQMILEELSLTPNQQVKCAANLGSDSVFQRKTFFAWEKWRFSPEEEPDAKSFWVVTLGRSIKLPFNKPPPLNKGYFEMYVKCQKNLLTS